MLLCYQGWTLEQISAAISIATPIILLVWFYYSRRQSLSKSYFDQIDGIYAGYTDPVSQLEDMAGLDAGIIMNIRETDDKGYFKGEFDFAESKTDIIGSNVSHRKLVEGIHTFFGKLDFKMHRDRSRNPFRPSENRKYNGTLYIVDRLDFAFNEYKIETYLTAEYKIVHYREMQTLCFTLKETYRLDSPNLPKSFTLYKKMGASFEPYANVKLSVFWGRTFSDK